MSSRTILVLVSVTVIIAAMLVYLNAQLTPTDNSTPSTTPPSPQDNEVSVSPNTTTTMVSQNSSFNIVKSVNTFGLQLAKKMLNGYENAILSPFSIYSALLPVYEASSGETRKELVNTLGLSGPETIIRESYQDLLHRLQSSEEALLIIANSLWVQKDLSLFKETMRVLEDYYNTEIRTVDFSHNPREAVSRINEWIENKTKGRIRNALNSLNRDTVAVIVNTVYFNATWQKVFREIGEKPFHISPNKTVKVPMIREVVKAGYYEDGMVKAVEIPYSGGNYSMLILLPMNTSIKSLLATLSQDYLEHVRSSMKWTRVNITIPVFRVERKYSEDLKKALEDMGLRRLFTRGKAELTKLFREYPDGNKLFLSEIIHQSFINVNRYGTEAAAATVVVVEVTAMIPPQYSFYADRPFIYMIVHRDTGLILFLGLLVDPASK